MNIKITKGSFEYLNECEEILMKSSLGNTYFQSEESGRRAIIEGLEQRTFFIAIDEGICIGFMYYIINGAFHSFPYLHLIVVKEEYRGKGIGKLLIKKFENTSDRDKFFLVVADFNLNAKRLYESIGYRQVGEVPGLYRNGITEYIRMKEKQHIPE